MHHELSGKMKLHPNFLAAQPQPELYKKPKVLTCGQTVGAIMFFGFTISVLVLVLLMLL